MEEFAVLVSALPNQNEARAVVLTGRGKYSSAGGIFDLVRQLDRPDLAEESDVSRPSSDRDGDEPSPALVFEPGQ
jgi:enoyl-CoA hydratase/carnithine racemase